MSKFPLLPDLSEEHIRYQDECKNLMIFDERLFVKREYQSDVNIDVIEKLTALQIPHFLFPEKIFVDDYNIYYFIVSKYLKNHRDFLTRLKMLPKEEVLLLYKKLLLSLKSAHEQGFNPFEITYLNYLLDDKDNPTFIDVGDSFYEGKPTSKYISKTNFDISYFGQNPQDFSNDNLILNDKIRLLAMLLQSLTYSYNMYATPIDLVNDFNKLKKVEILSGDILRYLENIIYKREVPQKEDYFIDDVIDPLLYNLKRKR